ncbi:hypothetical protein B0I35DRAFT_420151 [Stachybotrys elegans]|uniref:Phosphatidate phosphatase APP1 catalytic domain-containing protein n=1 Tax=Stachybotrys elegans TaxID=80388 RepID=A0A8K0T916_9HYPO|nr:hypothetical protein B0I35DRAFT_420151 [Stachybotrys elegans]
MPHTRAPWMLSQRFSRSYKPVAPLTQHRPGLIRLHQAWSCRAATSAPYRSLSSTRPNLRRTQGLLRSLIPRPVRDRYRQRLLDFHLNVLPVWKHRVQSWVYRRLVQRQNKHPRVKSRPRRIADLVAGQSRRLLLGSSLTHPHAKHVKNRTMTSGQNRVPTLTGLGSLYNTGANDEPTSPGGRGERGYRRKKLAAMAGNLYRTGQQAVTEMRESYAQTRGRGLDAGFENTGNLHIPGAFPNVAITVQGNEHLILFPSYAKRHTKQDWSEEAAMPHSQAQHGSIRDEDYWRREWERNEDEKAIVDVDVRGWVYSPHVGPLTRRNRILIGLARQLSGIPAARPEGTGPGASSGANSAASSSPHGHEDWREQEKIAQEAARIERRGQEEKRVAGRGGYSENPQESAEGEGMQTYHSRRGSQTPESVPGSPTSFARQSTNAVTSELTEAQLAAANVNLMARIAPFMTNPLVALPVTVMFFNDSKSQSRTVLTNEAGHFSIRAALDFIPTDVRVLANESLAATQKVKITDPYGVSLISDIDDTIKKSNISLGAREIFRSTFVHELGDLTVEGVREWYNELHAMGVSVHYCSNSPWQLFPVLASFFKLNGLPPGSLHLKQYSGMLQGIFEPVAERKKSTLTRLLRDFPSRKFLLVGDSGEADLEVYTELALSHPGRILAIFIRDVTTPEEPGYFDSSFEFSRRKSSTMSFDEVKPSSGQSTLRQNSAPMAPTGAKASTGPIMGTLIDFSEEPEELNTSQGPLSQSAGSKPAPHRAVTSAELLAGRKKPPPPRPNKPASLRSAPSNPDLPGDVGLGLSRSSTPSNSSQPVFPRRPGVPEAPEKPHPLTQMHNSSQQTMASAQSTPNDFADRPPPLPRRRANPSNLKSLSPRLFGSGRERSSNSDIDFDPLPPATITPPTGPAGYTRTGTRSGGVTPTGSPTLGPLNKKLEMWRRRLARAHELLDQQGVALYTWRKGQDVSREAVAIVQNALKDMERERRGSGR